jgi:serpin B
MFAAAIGLAGCSGGSGTSSAPTPSDRSSPVDLGRISLTAASVADARPGNVVMSPASVALALQMAYAGARGDTATEMAKVLHVRGVAPTEVAAAAARFLDDLAPLADDKDALLSLVNQVWVQDGFPLTTSYRTAMGSGFGAAFRRADFIADAESARQDINAAVADATHDRIQDLLAPGVLTDATRLVLTNAVYLRARWASEFSPGDTSAEAFHLSDGTAADVDTMQQEESFRYVHREGYQAVVLPYVGGRLAMTVLVPDGSSLDPLLGALRHRGLAALTAGAKRTLVELHLPRFRFSWDADLSGPLGALGMPTAFTPDADFSGITPAQRLHIQFVQHKAFVAVDEQGTEAAAATAVGVGVTGVMVPPPHPVVVRADHPFLFAITDTTTHLPLFLGRVADPRSTVDR